MVFRKRIKMKEVIFRENYSNSFFIKIRCFYVVINFRLKTMFVLYQFNKNRKMNCTTNQHIIILILIILFIGSLAGLSNFLNFHFKGLTKSKSEIWKYIVSGIGAATLVPLLLNMLSSNLIKDSQDFEQTNYFVFAGFCFVAGFFSERFINSIGDKILKNLAETNDKVDQAISTVKENEEKIDFIVETETEEADPLINLSELEVQTNLADDDIKTQSDKILKSFLGKSRFRSSKNIAKELNYSITIVEIILEQLKLSAIVKQFKKGDIVFWGLTKIGTQMAEKLKEKENE